MAAYAALSSLSRTTELLHEMIIPQSTTEGVHPRSSGERLQQLEKEVVSLRESTNFLLSFLENFGQKSTNQYEAQMKNAADEAEGIVGHFMSEQLRLKSATNDAALDSLYCQLQRAREGIMSTMVEKINNVCETVSDKESVKISDPFASRHIPLRRKELVIGVEDVFEEINRLVIEGSSTELRVVSVVGMGGIGKTTLARKFFNHIPTLEFFDIRGWVTVSQDFSARDVLVSLMVSIQPFVKQPKQRNESIENYVQKNLKEKRFLIVLDDVWSADALHFLMRTFPDDNNGSRILLTTRLREVSIEANLKEPIDSVMMRFMNESESENLLLHKVFQEERRPPFFDYISLEISRKCNGLPLAIVLVAGVLFVIGNSLREWIYILEKLSSHDKSRYEMVELILSLSYMLLPHHLRAFLLYMGSFPEDHEINVSMLTKQLLAQDFLRKPSAASSENHLVEECLEELVKRNLVSVLKRKSDDRIKSICLHDMVRDFCLKKAQEEEFLHCVADNDSHQDLTGRKIKVIFNIHNLNRICISDTDDSHTIMCFGRGRSPRISIGTRLRLLKSLDLMNVEIKEFPTEVFELFLLRLLALSHVPELSPSVSNLQHLETLIINPKDVSLSSLSLPCILCLPCEIWTMPRLRHIASFCCGALPDRNEKGLLPLQNLETLSAVMNLDCSESTMEMIPNVKKLGIFYFGVEPSTHSVKNIERLHRLEKLKLWVLVPFSSPQNLDLGFPATLRKLTLRGIVLSRQDMMLIAKLPHLQVLKLRRNTFERDEWRVPKYGFRELKYLLLEELGLRHWVSDYSVSVLPMLRTLVVRKCNELREMTRCVRFIQTLELIEVVGCRKSLVESARSIKVIQQSNGYNPNLEVAIKKYG